MERQTENSFGISADNRIVEGVQAIVREAHEELRQLLQLRADLTRRIGTVKKTVAGLASLFDESIFNDDLKEFLNQGKAGRRLGFTKTCRAILMESNSPISVRDIYDRIQERDPALMERHKDPFASIATVLNRLVNYGEAERVILHDNKRAWQWASEPGAKSIKWFSQANRSGIKTAAVPIKE